MSALPEAVAGFLARAGWSAARPEPLAGDASQRRFTRLASAGGGTVVLMQDPGGAAATRRFERVAGLLRGLGLSAPAVLAADHEGGLLLVEDFGDRSMAALIDGGAPVRPLLERAADLLVELHRRFDPAAFPEAERYDSARFTEQAALLFETGLAAPAARGAFEAACAEVLSVAFRVPDSLLLRDFFAGNVMWLADRPGVLACGLLDFQDAGLGPVSYDLASLLDDARRDFDDADREAVLARYLDAFPRLDRETFAASLAAMAAMRHLRVLAVFTRLAERDGRRGYLAYRPRVAQLLRRRLAHPALAPLAGWANRHMTLP